MRIGGRGRIAMGMLAAATATGACSALAGIEDFHLTGPSDAAAEGPGTRSDAAADAGGSDGGGHDGGSESGGSDSGGGGSDTGGGNDTGAGTDTGAKDTGAKDTGNDASAPTDCPGSFLLCDGFESDSIDSSRWNPPVALFGSTVVVDGANPHRGAYSLHIHVPAVTGSGFFQAYVAQSSVLGSGVLFIRAWFYLSALPGPDNDTLIEVDSNANGESASGAVGFSSTDDIVDAVENAASDNYALTSGTAMPLGRWICLEMGLDTTYAGSWPDGHLQVWDDGTTKQDVGLEGSALLQTLRKMSLGIQFPAPSTSAIDVFVDDIAVDRQFIGCAE